MAVKLKLTQLGEQVRDGKVKEPERQTAQPGQSSVLGGAGLSVLTRANDAAKFQRTVPDPIKTAPAPVQNLWAAKEAEKASDGAMSALDWLKKSNATSSTRTAIAPDPLDMLKPGSASKPTDLYEGKLTAEGAKAENIFAQRELDRATTEAAQKSEPLVALRDAVNMAPNEKYAEELLKRSGYGSLQEVLDEIDAYQGSVRDAVSARDATPNNYYHLKNKKDISAVRQDSALSSALDRAVELGKKISDYTYETRNDPGNFTEVQSFYVSEEDKARQEEYSRWVRERNALIEQLDKAGYDGAKLVDYFVEQHEAERAELAKEELRKFGDKYPGVASFVSVGAAPAQGVDYLNAALTSAIEGPNDPTDLEHYKPLTAADFPISNAVSSLREGASADMGNVGKFLYNTGMSMADSALLVSTLGPAATVVMGASSAANTAADVVSRGGTNGQALAAGLAAGIAEGFFEKYSVESLLTLKAGKGQFFKNLVKQSFTEAEEEALTEISNILTDALIMAEKSNFSVAVQNYRDNGEPKAKAEWLAFLDNIAQVGLSALGGAISGGVMGGGKMGASNLVGKAQEQAAVIQIGEGMKENSKRIETMEVGRTYAEGTKTKEIADKIFSATEGGKDLSAVNAAQWGRLAKAMLEEAEHAPSPARAKAAAEGEAVVSETENAFLKAGDSGQTAAAKAAIMDRLLSGDTAVSDTDLRTLELDSKSTRDAWEALTDTAIPSTHARKSLFEFARSTAQAVANHNAQGEAAVTQLEQAAAQQAAEMEGELAETQARVQEQAAAAQKTAMTEQVKQALDTAETEAKTALEAAQAEAKAIEARMAEKLEKVKAAGETIRLTDGTTGTWDEYKANYEAAHPDAKQGDAEASWKQLRQLDVLSPKGVDPGMMNRSAVAATETAQNQTTRSSVGGEVPPAQNASDGDYKANLKSAVQESTVRYINGVLERIGSRTRASLGRMGAEGPNAEWHPSDGSVTLNADKLDAEGFIVEITGHELFHEAVKSKGGTDSEWGKQMIGTLLAMQTERMGDEGAKAYRAEQREAYIKSLVKKETSRAKAEGEMLSADELRRIFAEAKAIVDANGYMDEELAADELRRIFKVQGGLDQLAKSNRSGLLKMRDWIQHTFAEMMIGDNSQDMAKLFRKDFDPAEYAAEEAERKKFGKAAKAIVERMNEALTKAAEHGTDKANTTQEVRNSVDGRLDGEKAGRYGESKARGEAGRNRDGQLADAGERRDTGRGGAERGHLPGADTGNHVDEAVGRSGRRERAQRGETGGQAVAGIEAPRRAADRIRETIQTVYGTEAKIMPREYMQARGKNSPAFSRNGVAHISEDAPEHLWTQIAHHEPIHQMKELKFQPYLDFISRSKDYLKDTALSEELILEATTHRGIYPNKFPHSQKELTIIMDEINAMLHGGYMADPASMMEFAKDVLTDPWGYFHELLDVVEQFKVRNEQAAANTRFSVTATDTTTPEFREWFNDDSGELTNPDGTPKVFLRGDSFSGATKFPDGASNYSGGIFFSTKRDVADNYAEMHSTLGGLGVYSEEFIPRDLKSWNEAFLWVEGGNLGPLTALEREGPEWEFMTRTFDPGAALNGMRPFSKWKTVASYPNTQAGLAQFNAEYGDLMRGVQNPGFMKCYLSAEHTLVVDAKGRGWNNVDGRRTTTNDTAVSAWEKGYDCVVIKNVVDGGTEGEFVMDEDGYEYYRQIPITVIIVRDSGQVKSIYNTGTWDRSNPDVRYSVDAEAKRPSPSGVPDWDAQVSALLNGSFDELFWGDGWEQSSLYVMYEPTALLQDIGLSDLPLVTTKRHARNNMSPRWDANGKVINDSYHDMTEEQYRRLPELIRNPVAVLLDHERSGHLGGLNIVTNEVDSHGNAFFIAIKPDQRSFTHHRVAGPAHFVNVIGRNDYEGYILRAIKNGEVAFINKEKFDASPWLTPAIRSAISTAKGIEFDAIIKPKRETVKPGERKFSVDGRPYAEPMYSQMERVLEGVKQEKLGAASVVSMLRGKGVKAEEIKWSGIEQFLEGKKSVTKQELLEFAQMNALELEEQALDGHREITDLTDQTTGEVYTDMDHMRTVVENMAEEMGYDPDEVRYDDNDFPDFGRIVAYVIDPETGEDFELTTVQAKISDKSPLWEEHITPGGDNYRELLYKMPGSDYSNQAMRVHWGQDEGSGVLAHARVQDFDTPDGKMLFIEEIQSDWHNKGAKEGYVAKDVESLQQELRDLRAKSVLNGEMTEVEVAREAELNKALYPRHAELNAKLDALKAQMTTNPLVASALDKIAEVKFGGNRRYAENNLLSARTSSYTDDLHAAGVELTRFERDAIREFIFKKEDWSREFNEYTMNGGREAELANRAPEAPYSKNYHEYVLKRLLRMAAEYGYDSIGWTTGKMQEDRWSSEYAEGYRIEYDQDMPKFLRKYGKQWGAEVEKTRIPNGLDAETIADQEDYLLRQIEQAENDAESYERNGWDSSDERNFAATLKKRLEDLRGPEVWTMKITPGMRHGVLYEGQSRYSVDGLQSDTPGGILDAREVNRRFIRDFTGDVREGERVSLSRREFAAISHALKTGYGKLWRDGVTGWVTALGYTYDFTVTQDNAVLVTDFAKSSDLNIHRSEIKGEYAENVQGKHQSFGPASEGGRDLGGRSDRDLISGAAAESSGGNDKVAAGEPRRHSVGDPSEIAGDRQPEVRFSIDGRPLADPLYSQLERVLDEYKGEKVGAQSLISHLTNHGVKAEEIKWSGIEQFLEGKKSVTRDELIEFLRANELVIEDVVLSDDAAELATPEEKAEMQEADATTEKAFAEIARIADEMDFPQTRREIEQMAGRDLAEYAFFRIQQAIYMDFAVGAADREAVPTRKELYRLAQSYDNFGFDYANYAVNSMRDDPAAFAEAYDMSDEDRAYLMDYAAKKERNAVAAKEWAMKQGAHAQEMLRLTTEGEEAAKRRRKIAEAVYNRRRGRTPRYEVYATYPEGGRKNYREVLFRLPSVGEGLHSPHWDQSDVLAHTRLQDMVDAEGKRVLFVDEVQSDWHQAGRDEGYTRPEMAKIEKEYREAQRAAHRADAEARAVEPGPEHDAEWRALEQKRRDAVDRMNEAETRYFDAVEEYGRDTVPDAPYRNTWHEYVMKRVLRMAAEGGYDKVAWTTGQMQADRYKLSSTIDSVDVTKEADGTYFVHVYRNGSYIPQTFTDMAAKDMTTTFGNDLGNRLMRGADELTQPWETGEIFVVDGDGLTIGGEGMKNFYDVGGKSSQNIPKFLNKYLKPWGVKVKSDLVGMDLRDTSAYLDGGMEEVMRIYQTGLTGSEGLFLVPSVDITDQMRDDLLYKGQTRYSVDGVNSDTHGGMMGAQEEFEPGGETDPNTNPDTGFKRDSVADNAMQLIRLGAREDAIRYLTEYLTALEKVEEQVNLERRAKRTEQVLRPELTEETVRRNKEVVAKLIDKYGKMEQTSAAQREVNLPKQIDDETYVAGGVQTMMAAKATPEPVADEFVRSVLAGDAGLTYARVSDAPAIAKAEKELEDKGFEKMLRDWETIIDGDKAIDKVDIARAEQLYIEACSNKDVVTAMKLAAQIAEAGTRAGQTVQAFTLLKKMTPSGQMYYLQRAVNRLNEEQAAKLKTPITMDTKLVENLLKAKTAEEVEAAREALLQSIADQVPVTLWDKLNAWRYLSMLGNPRTHIRNLLGNAIFTPARLARDILATAAEKALPQEQRTKAIVADKGLKEFAKRDADAMRETLAGGGKYNPVHEIMDRRAIYKHLGFLNTASKFNMNAMEAEDWIFLKRAYASSLSKFLTARGFTAGDVYGADSTKKGRQALREAREYAVREAQKATYRDMSEMAAVLNRCKRNLQNGGLHKKIGYALLEGVVPFTKTPINIVKRGIEYSPAGLVKGIYDLTKGVKNGNVTAAEGISELCAGFTGTMVACVGALLAHLGLLTAGLGDDEEDEALKRQGYQEYALNLGGTSYTIDWMAPVALPLFVGAEIYNAFTRDNSEVDAGQALSFVADGLTTILEPMLSLTMLDGLEDLLTANKYSDGSAFFDAVAAAGLSYAGQIVPTLFGQIARTVDDSRRTSFTEKGTGTVEGTLQRFWQNSVQGKVPFYEKGKLLWIDNWGRTDTVGSVALRALENFLSPGYINTINTTVADEELDRLAKATGDNGVYPNKAAKYFSVDGETYAMTQEEYENHLLDRGQTSYRLVTDIINDPLYRKLDDKQKAEAIELAYDYAANMAKVRTNSAYAAELAKWQSALSKLEEQGADVAEYLLMKTSGGDMEEMIIGAGWSRGTVATYVKETIDTDRRSPSAFVDPNRAKHEFVLNENQQKRYTNTWDSLFDEGLTKLYASTKWEGANTAERAALLDELKTDVTAETKDEMARYLRSMGIRSTAT